MLSTKREFMVAMEVVTMIQIVPSIRENRGKKREETWAYLIIRIKDSSVKRRYDI